MSDQISTSTEITRSTIEPAFFRHLIDHLNDAVEIIDGETARFIDVNHRACTDLGYTREELLQLGVVDIDPTLPSDFDWQRQIEIVQNVPSLLFQGQHQRKDGSIFPVEVSITYLEQHGKGYVLAVSRDVTERRRLEAELKQAVEAAETANRALTARSAELERSNESMRRVLDNIEQGLALVDTYGHLTSERSAAFDRWFDAPDPERPYWQHLAGAAELTRSQLQLGYEALVEGVLPVALALEQLPKELARGARRFTLEHRPVFRDGRLEATLLVVSDVTAELEAQRLEAEHAEQRRTFERILADRGGFLEFQEEASRLVQALAADKELKKEELLRNVHTLKGTCAMFDVQSVSQAAHELEQALLDQESTLVARARSRVIVAWETFLARVAPLCRQEGAGRIELTPAELDELLAAARSQVAPAELARRLESLADEALRVRFARLGEQAAHLSRRFGKGEPEVINRAGNLRLPYERYSRFWSVFSHLLRNAVVHGFQTPEERQRAGKPARNRLEFAARTERDRVVVEIRDDGRGIDWPKIREQAQKGGLPHATPQDLVAALFHDGISTAVTVSESAGRGVGLAAVAAVCRELGGSLDVESPPSGGACFRLDLPLLLGQR